MTSAAILLLSLSSSASWSAETVSPLWTAELNGECIAPVSANADYVIVGNARKMDAIQHRCFRSSDGTRVPISIEPGNDELAPPKPPSAAKPVFWKDHVILQFSNGAVSFTRLQPTWLILNPGNPAQDYDARGPLKGYASSPLIYDGKLIVMPGAQTASIMAIDLEKGEELWKSPGRRASRADLIGAEFGGVKQIVAFDHDSLGGWASDTGKRLWTLPTPDRIEDAPEKLIETNGQLLASTSDGVTTLYRFNAGGILDEKPVARNAGSKGLIQTLAGRLAFGVGEHVFALNLDEGLKEAWHLDDEVKAPNEAWLQIEDGRLLVFSKDGKLSMYTVNASKAELVGTWQLCDSIVARPAIAEGRLFVRGAARLSCFDFKALTHAAK